MRTLNFQRFLLCSILFTSVFCSCKKSSSNPTNDLSAINGSWQTTVWGGNNDTAIINVSSSTANGTFTYLNSGALQTKFSVGDAIYSNIKSLGNGTYSCNATYRYDGSGGSNSTVGNTTAVLTLQNNNTVLFAHYAKDASSGITPPDYYWSKQ